ncbi:MAG: doubled motif LPXTG anchor domain-containing protein [Lawsonibacter sp.]|jgi:hypothetical protein|nr:doubled motif LPXTG anchor domain-containing protein [Lawsonibacter sp.]
MKKIYGRSLKRALALSVALVMSLTPALAAKTVESRLVCGQTAHSHTDSCYKNVEVKELTCSDPSHSHTHSDDCYVNDWTLDCSIPEGGGSVHTHDDSCYTDIEVLTCGESESEGHSHDSGCYTTEVETTETLTCSETEGPDVLDEEGNVATPGHTHGSGCYEVTETTKEVLSCSESESAGHSHSDSCYESQKQLTCSTSDLPAHAHGEGCYKANSTLVCGQTESPHTDGCYTTKVTEEKVLDCTTTEHVHTSGCYATSGKNEDGSDWNLAKELQNALDSDEDVTLILNGVTLNYNEVTGETSIRVTDGKELTIADGEYVKGGTITNNDTTGKRVITVVSGGKVHLTGDVTITGGKGTGGGGVYVGKDSEFNMSNGSISNNNAIKDSNGGGVLVENGGKFTMTGGTISNNTTTQDGGGVAVGNGGKFEMEGGTISGNTANSEDWSNTGKPNEEPTGQGGGVYVDIGAEFDLKGGTISGNKAGEGGGIFVEHSKTTASGYVKNPGKLNMTGGTVDGNTATLGEGGGIYIQGKGEISGGRITNNVTYTTKDLGGGGIYIEADGSLKLTNAIVTSNTANGLGGGLSACVHGQTIVYVKDGAAIYGNTSLGSGHTAGHLGNGDKIDGYSMWAANEIFKEFAQDVFTAGDATQSNSQGTAGIIIGNEMLGGGDANWEGYTYCYATDPKTGELQKDPDGNYILELNKVEQTDNGPVFGNRMVFLTAHPDQAAINSAINAMKTLAEGKGVLIAGNLSANTHGGGIANNGFLQIGEESEFKGTNDHDEDIGMHKTLTNTADNSEMKIDADRFTFEMRYPDGTLVPGGSVSNDANGNATFTFPHDIFTKPDTYTFYVTEPKGTEDGIGYDGTTYRITIVVTEKSETVKIGDKTVTMTTLTVGDPLIQKTTDKDGNVLETPETVNGITFNNTYTPDNPPPPPTEEGEDPEDPHEDPEDPGEDIPDPEVPLAPPPEEEITEPEVPLAPPPEEEVEIPDDPVPLADVPATGDISILWYAAAVMSACGLALLNLFKKKTEE